MNEDEISSTGRFSTLGSTDFATAYQRDTPAAAAATSGAAAVQPGAPAAVAATKVSSPPTAAQIKTAVDLANANLASSNRVLDFRVDAATGLTIAMIRNAQTGVVLQQMPGADVVALAQMLADWSPGKHMLLDLIA